MSEHDEDGAIRLTPEVCEARAVTTAEALAVESPEMSAAWADPASRLLVLHGIRIGVAAVFEGIVEGVKEADHS